MTHQKKFQIVSISFIALALVSCGKELPDQTQGVVTPSASTGSSPAAAEESSQNAEVHLTARREYFPDRSIKASDKVPNGFQLASLPTHVKVTTGNAGQGWLRVKIGKNWYCYKGTASHVNKRSKKFKYDHKREKGQCQDSTQKKKIDKKELKSIAVAKNTKLYLEILGKGCNQSQYSSQGYCRDTDVTVIIGLK